MLKMALLLQTVHLQSNFNNIKSSKMKKNNIYTAPIIEDMVCAVEKGFTVSEPSGAGFKDYTEEDFAW